MRLLSSPPVLPTLSTACYCRHNNSEGLRRANKNATQIIELPTQSSTCPTDFHIGCHVTVTSSHPTHAGKAGTVCRHTKKYVMFTPDEQTNNIIRILPKSLAATILTYDAWSTLFTTMRKRPRTDRMRARHVRSNRRNKNLPSCRRLCQLYADVQISKTG
jgi:RNase P/RNase MRP subunit p29